MQVFFYMSKNVRIIVYLLIERLDDFLIYSYFYKNYDNLNCQNKIHDGHDKINMDECSSDDRPSSTL